MYSPPRQRPQTAPPTRQWSTPVTRGRVEQLYQPSPVSARPKSAILADLSAALGHPVPASHYEEARPESGDPSPIVSPEASVVVTLDGGATAPPSPTALLAAAGASRRGWQSRRNTALSMERSAWNAAARQAVASMAPRRVCPPKSASCRALQSALHVAANATQHVEPDLVPLVNTLGSKHAVRAQFRKIAAQMRNFAMPDLSVQVPRPHSAIPVVARPSSSSSGRPSTSQSRPSTGGTSRHRMASTAPAAEFGTNDPAPWIDEDMGSDSDVDVALEAAQHSKKRTQPTVGRLRPPSARRQSPDRARPSSAPVSRHPHPERPQTPLGTSQPHIIGESLAPPTTPAAINPPLPIPTTAPEADVPQGETTTDAAAAPPVTMPSTLPKARSRRKSPKHRNHAHSSYAVNQFPARPVPVKAALPIRGAMRRAQQEAEQDYFMRGVGM